MKPRVFFTILLSCILVYYSFSRLNYSATPKHKPRGHSINSTMKSAMNMTQSIYKREKGFKTIHGYDVALLRLKCCAEDEYQGVAPNTDSADLYPKPPIFACKFSTAPGYEQVIALANEDGKIALQDTNIKYDTEEPFEGIQAHNNAIFDIAWMPQELKLITASGERTACLWDVNSDVKQLQTFYGHTHSLKSVVFRHQDKAVFATGARDGAIMIWDIRASHNGQPKPDNTIFNAHEMGLSSGTKHKRTPSQTKTLTQSVTALAFHDDYSLISSSAGDGLIKVWDLRKNYTIHKKEPIAKYVMKYGGKSNTYNGFTSLLVDPAGITLYASCIDKKIYAYNLSSYNENPVAEYYGHGMDDKVLTFFVKACISPDGEYLASGSNDETAYIWSTRSPGIPIAKLTEHRDEVTCIAWCSVGPTKIVTCSDDCHHRIWRIKPEEDYNDDVNIVGFAERYEKPPNISPSRLSVSSTPSSISLSSSCSETSGSIKRPNSRASNESVWSAEKYKSILSPIQEKLESSPRRSSFEARAARKLHFSPSVRQAPALGSPSASERREAAAAGSSTFSPTSGLPNFVVDGTAPHLLGNSPQKSKENVDWLTMLRKRKSGESDSPSPKTRKTPSRRSRLRLGELRKTPKSSKFFVPAITNFYTNLNLESANTQSSCSS